MPRRRTSLAATLALVLAACAPDAAETSAPEASRPAAPSSVSRVEVGVIPAFGQASSGPRFAWGRGAHALGGRIEAQAMDALRTIAPTYGLSPASLAAAEVSAVRAQANGATIVEITQRAFGVDVLDAKLRLLFDRDGRFVAAGGRLAPDARAPRAVAGVLDARAAVGIALDDLGAAVPPGSIASAGTRRGLFDDYVALPPSGLTSPARARSVLARSTSGRGLVPAFEIEVFARVAGAEKAARYVVSAATGVVLETSSLLHHAPFSYRVWADPAGDHIPLGGPHADFWPHPTGVPDQSTPTFIAPSLVTIDGLNVHQDPWLLAGATSSKGNNVDAYTDDDDPDGFSGAPDLRAAPIGGAFEYTYDLLQDPLASDTQRMASVTQAFYTVNWLHDHWYDVGFDEKAGNAQASNFGRGGFEGDPLLVEVQDGAPTQTDNANAAVPSDGASPRIQVYVWSGKSSSSLMVGAQSFTTNVAHFGPKNFDLTSPIVRANDAIGNPSDACEAIGSSVAGKIALVDRGTCAFKQKVVNAELAGATGVIIANVMPGSPPSMPDGPPAASVTIPVLSVSQSTGAVLDQAILTGPTIVSMLRSTEPLRDGALDNLIVAHEWGHYLHRRLTVCSTHQCDAESEGWADYVALALAMRDGDDLGGVYSQSIYAPYAGSDDSAYFGLRRFPYSTDMSKNPLTFQHIAAGAPLPATAPMNSAASAPNEEEHAAGEVWAQMLLEAHVALLGNATKPNAPYTLSEARKRMASYVVTGLQLAPDNPTYTEQRDAILAAAVANDPADAILVAQAFAKRGAGSCALSPPRESEDLTGVVESFVIAPNPSIVALTVADDTNSCDADGYLDGGEAGTAYVVIENPSPAALTDGTLTLASGDGAVTFPAGASIPVPMVAAFGSATVSIPVARSGVPKVVTEISATLAAPSACAPTSTVTTPFAVSVDEAKTGSDGFEATTSTWSLDGDGADQSWSLGPIGATNHGWRGRDADVLSDRSLVSPPIAVAAGANLVVGFSHAYSFEESQGTFWDGGVVEISKDGGPWEDASKYANPAYVADIGGNGENPLFGRPAFVGASASYPVPAPETLTFGTSFGGSTVKLRFRIGTDTAAGADGWIIDDIIVAGAASPPFVGLVADACEPPTPATTSVASSSSTGAGGDGGGGGSPDDDDGCGCIVAAEPSSVRPALVLLGIALGALRVRRRRSAQKQS